MKAQQKFKSRIWYQNLVSVSNYSRISLIFFFFLIDKEKLYIKKRGDTKNSALRVYRKYTKEAKRLKPEGEESELHWSFPLPIIIQSSTPCPTNTLKQDEFLYKIFFKNVQSLIDNITLMISTSWSTPLSPGNKGCTRRWLDKSLNNRTWKWWKAKASQLHLKLTVYYLSQKQFSHHTASRPNIYSSRIFSGTKYEFWGTVISWADIRNIGFSFYLIKRKADQHQAMKQDDFMTPLITSAGWKFTKTFALPKSQSFSWCVCGFTWT